MRTFLVSKELSNKGFSVRLVYDGSYKEFIDYDLRVRGVLHDYDQNDYAESLRRVKEEPTQFPFGDMERLESIVKDEISLIEQFKPKLVVGDTRLSLLISSQATSVPYVSIINGNMHPTYKPISSKFKEHAKKQVEFYNEVLKKFGLKNFVENFYEILIGDLNLIADLSEFVGMREIPSATKLVGPILWSHNGIPSWFGEIKRKKENGEKFAYVTMGSTGDSSIFKIIFDGLRKTDYNIIVASAGLVDNLDSGDLYSANFMFMDILDYCDLTVCHGGNSTIYLSLLHQCPVVGIPSNPDQIDNVNRAIVLKLGVGVYPDVLRSEDVGNLINFILSNPNYQENVNLFSQKLKNVKGERVAANIIAEYLRGL